MSSPLCPQDPSDPNVRYRHLLDRSALRADIKNRSTNAGLMLLGGQAGQVILKLVSITVLARLLTPDDYGLVGMAWVFAVFVSMFSDMGLSMATVQREHITHEQVSTLYWLNMAICAFLAAVIAALAPAAAWFYREPRVLNLMLAFAALPLVSGLAMQPRALLTRQMRQKALAAIRLGSTVAAVGVAIVMAALGASYWSLVGLEATQTILATAGILAAAGWRPSLPRRGTGTRSMLRFGGALTVANLVSYWGRKGDDLLIGRFLGAYPLGIYTRAYSIMCLPLTHIVAPLRSIAIPALSAIRKSPSQFRDYYLQFIRLIADFSLPLVAFAVVMSDGIIRIGLGPGWSEAAPIFGVLAVGGFLQTVWVPLGALCVALGKTRRLMTWVLLSTPLVFLSFACGLPWGAIGVATSYTACMAVVIIPSSHLFLLRGTPVSAGDVLRAIRVPMLQAVLVAGVLIPIRLALQEFAYAPWAVLSAALLTVATWVLSNLLFRRDRRLLGHLGPAFFALRRSIIARPIRAAPNDAP